MPSSSPSPSAVSIPTSSESFSRAARSSLASENSPSSIPSPTYQWTKALLAYMRSNLWSILEKTSAMAVELETMQTALMTLARSPPGTTVGGGDGGVDILWYDITSVHEAACHVLSVSWITLGHHGGWLEGGVGDLSNGELFVISFLGRDDWCI